MSALAVRVDRDSCIGCGACWISCPDVFEQNQEDGHSQIVKQYRVGNHLSEGIIPPDLEGCARSAEESCPVQIIHLTQSER
ncbi:MAG: ferredoxin [Candidatus Hadarchaeum sp.]|uniref:ferredoxin n=1 Tax=Candidatus Hadarchaeum sp. TaxID=2883567 RepID=UPI003D0A58ED